MKGSRKVTVLLPKDLLRKAIKATGLGIAPTIRKGLESLTTAAAYDALLESEGKWNIPRNFGKLRDEDR